MKTTKYVNKPEIWERLHNYLSIPDIDFADPESEKIKLLEIVSEMIEHTTKMQEKPEFKADEIFEKVCNEYDLQPEFVLENNKSRERHFVEIRQITWYIWNELGLLKYITTQGCKYFDKDHSTVTYAIKTMRNLHETDSNIKMKINNVLNQL
jgi:chromosomal replication initiation ATPase DnaA